jgi:HEAT repeat protein
LKDDWHEVRENAARSLGQLGDRRAVEPLMTAITDPEFLGRDFTGTRRIFTEQWVVAWALGQLADSRAVIPLVLLLEDREERNRKAAAESLERLTGQRFGTDAAKWKAWLEKRK